MYNREQFEILDNDVIVSHINEFRNTGCTESRDKVVLSNIRTAQYLANKFGRKHRESVEDLMHEGIIAIFDAIKNYDVTSKSKFSSYCYTYIKGYMLNKLKQKFNQTVSLDYEYGENFTLMDSVVSKGNTSLEDLISSDNKKRLINALGNLTERDRKIIEMYFGFNNDKMNQEQIGLKFNLTKQAIGQIIKRNLEVLKEHI